MTFSPAWKRAIDVYCCYSGTLCCSTASAASHIRSLLLAQTSGSDECQLTREAAPPSVSPVHTVYVGNLAVTVNERHLWDAFGVCGRIRSLQVSARMLLLLNSPPCTCSSKAQPSAQNPLHVSLPLHCRSLVMHTAHCKSMLSTRLARISTQKC